MEDGRRFTHLIRDRDARLTGALDGRIHAVAIGVLIDEYEAAA